METYDNEYTNGYQRLEFLGDSLLDFLVTDHIYKNQPVVNHEELTPGMLTDLRSALVNNITFGSLSVRYGFHKLLLHFAPKLQESIDTFVHCQERNNHQVTGAVRKKFRKYTIYFLGFPFIIQNKNISAEI